MRLTQVVPVESYTEFQGYTQNHFMGTVSLTVESKCILLYDLFYLNKIYFIIIII